MRGSTTRARTSSRAPVPLDVRRAEDGSADVGRSARDDSGVMAGRQRSCEATGRRRDHQYELGSRADRHARNQPAALCRSQRRRARVQQVAGAIGGSARARQRARAGMDRDLVCRGLDDPIGGMRWSSRLRSPDGEPLTMSRAQPCFWRHRPPHS